MDSEGVKANGLKMAVFKNQSSVTNWLKGCNNRVRVVDWYVSTNANGKAIQYTFLYCEGEE